MSTSETSSRSTNGRNPLFFIGGILLLGLAAALLLFGGDLLGADDDEPVLGRVPEFDFGEAAQPVPASGSLADATVAGELQVGARAPNFTLLDLDNNAVSLADFDGRPVIINFWATWCAPCRLEMPGLETVFQERQDEGLAILAVNLNEPADKVTAFFYDELALSFTPLLDPGGEVAAVYGVGRFLPTSYFIDENGVITAVHRGLMTEGQVNGYLDQNS